MTTIWLSGGVEALFVIDEGVLDVEQPGYTRQAIQLMPHGPAWDAVRRTGTTMRALVEASARSFARVHTAIDRLRREIFPDTTDELIAVWETFAGLPGLCIENPPVSLEDRRAALVAKLYRSRGPLTRETAESIATSLGYTTITWVLTFTGFKCGSKCGTSLAGLAGGWQWHGLMVVSPSNPDRDEILRCLIEDAAHAHLTVTVITEP